MNIIPENVFARTHLEKILPQELKNKSVCYTVLYSGSWQEITDLQSIAKQVKKQNKVLLLDNSGEGFVHYIKALYDLLINEEKLKFWKLYKLQLKENKLEEENSIDIITKLPIEKPVRLPSGNYVD